MRVLLYLVGNADMPVLPSNQTGTDWSYDTAFSRNRGLITAEEQQLLRSRRVAIVGMGGVGGIDLVTLARLGIGRFTIADPDVFELSNTNRQYGAMQSTLGCSKADTMANVVREINPGAELRIFTEPIGPDNAAAFLEGADVLVDGIDAFEIEVRRLLFGMAAKRGIHALGAGPVGFSTVWVIVDPHGMSFDRYFDLSDRMNALEKFVAYIVGMTPKATHRSYMDFSQIDARSRTGPSASLACQLSAGVIGAEVLKLLLRRGTVYSAPYYHQFDPYLGRYVRGRLRGGNRNPMQRLKRARLCRFLKSQMATVARSES